MRHVIASRSCFGCRINQGLLWLRALGVGVPLISHQAWPNLGRGGGDLCKHPISTTQATGTKLCPGIQVEKVGGPEALFLTPNLFFDYFPCTTLEYIIEKKNRCSLQSHLEPTDSEASFTLVARFSLLLGQFVYTSWAGKWMNLVQGCGFGT